MRGGGKTMIVVMVMALALVAILIFVQSGKNEKDYYQLIGVLPNSGGLSSGQDINCRGQKIGHIKRTDLQHSERVLIVMMIHNDTTNKIPIKSSLKVNIDFLLGGKSLAIIPDTSCHIFCQPGDTLWGQAPVTLNNVLENANTAIDTIKDKISQIDISGLNQAIATINHAASQADTTIKDLRPQIDSTVSHANELITTYQRTGKKIETTVVAIDSLVQKGSKSLDNLPTTIQHADSAIQQIKSAGTSFEKLMKALKKLCFWSKN